MKTLQQLNTIQGGNPLFFAALAFRTMEFCLGQWEESRKEHHDRIDREMKQYQFDQELQRKKQLNSLKDYQQPDSI